MVWVSSLRGRAGSSSRLVFDAFEAGHIRVVTCGKLVDEVARVLDELGVPSRDIESFVMLLCANADIVPIAHQAMGSPDPDDDALLETALVGRARYIVSRDPDLLALPQHVRDYCARNGIFVRHPERFARYLRAVADV